MKLDLLSNSHSFLRESVKNALDAAEDTQRWPFAILHVVQAAELTLKAMLVKHHRLLLFDNIDTPTKTVSLSKAIDRLSSPLLGICDLSEADLRKLTKSFKLRNQITHSEFECSPEYAQSKFAEVFALVTYLQARHFSIELETLINPADVYRVLEHATSLAELLEKAKTRIADEDLPPAVVWTCPECGEDTFVAKEGIDTCYLCRHSSTVGECPHCKSPILEDDLQDVSFLFEYTHNEGQTLLINDFGYHEHLACRECESTIQEDIEQQKFEEHERWLDFDADVLNGR